jgi:hypothetical protein
MTHLAAGPGVRPESSTGGPWRSASGWGAAQEESRRRNMERTSFMAMPIYSEFPATSVARKQAGVHGYSPFVAEKPHCANFL